MAFITSVSASSNSQMVVCCRCNAERRCKNCSSKKAGMKCVSFDCLPLRKSHCENEPVEVPNCYEKKVNVSIINSQAEVNSRFTRSALTELSSLEVDLEMPPIVFPQLHQMISCLNRLYIYISPGLS